MNKKNEYRLNLIKGLVFLVTFFVFFISSVFGFLLMFIHSLFPTDFFKNEED